MTLSALSKLNAIPKIHLRSNYIPFGKYLSETCDAVVSDAVLDEDLSGLGINIPVLEKMDLPIVEAEGLISEITQNACQKIRSPKRHDS